MLTNGSASAPGTCVGYRHCLMILGFCGLAICYIMRILPGIAIVSMVKSETSQMNTVTDGFYMHPKKFNWSAMEQNTILSSFFYSYFAMQFPSGWISQRVGGKWPFAIGISTCGFIAILIPKAVEFGGFTAFFLLRLLQGFCQGMCFPSLHRVAGSWFPPREFALLSSIMHSGYIAGTVLALIGSGYLISLNGSDNWPLPFYVSGAFALVWLPFWLIFVSEKPDSHPYASDSEKQYIVESLQNTAQTDQRAVPWRRIATSGQVWLIMACYFMDGWANYTLLVCVPQYMNSVLQVPINENGVLSALPYIMSLVFLALIVPIDRMLIHYRLLSIPVTRKLWSGLSAFGKSILLLAIAYLDAKYKGLIIVLLVLNVMLSSAMLLGFNLADLDLAPPYAGILFSIFNSCSTFSAVLSPLVVGAFSTIFPAPIAWQNVFIVASALSFFCGFLYLLLGRQAPLHWVLSAQEQVPLLDHDAPD